MCQTCYVHKADFPRPHTHRQSPLPPPSPLHRLSAFGCPQQNEDDKVFDDIERRFESANVLASTLVERLRTRASNSSNTVLGNLRQKLCDAEEQVEELKKTKQRLQRLAEDAGKDNQRLREDLKETAAQLAKARAEMDALKKAQAANMEGLRSEFNAERSKLERRLTMARRMGSVRISAGANSAQPITADAATQSAAAPMVSTSTTTTATTTATAATTASTAGSTSTGACDGAADTALAGNRAQQVIAEQLEQIEELSSEMQALRERSDAESTKLQQQLDEKTDTVTGESACNFAKGWGGEGREGVCR